MNKKRKAVIAGNQVSRMVAYSLGGYSQKVLLEGRRATLPVMLFLHGGPGFPLPFSAGCRGMFPEFTDHFILAYWDQLGCGINNHPIDNSFTVEHFVQMTLELLAALKKDFPHNPLYIFGVSWGSILAAVAAQRAPHLLDGALIYGQAVESLAFNQEVYSALENAPCPPRVLARLERIINGKARGGKEAATILGWVRRYTEGYSVKKAGKAPIWPIIWGLWTSPDYSHKDFFAMVLNGYRRNKSLLDELTRLDLGPTLSRIQIPYHILQGEKDIVTPTRLVARAVEGAGNTCLRLRIIKNSAHNPGERAMEEILAEALSLPKGT